MHSANASEPAISVTGLVKSFGDVRALDGVDLEVAAGHACSGCSAPTARARRRPCASSPRCCKPDAGTVRGRGPRRRPRRRRAARADRPRRPVRGGRREPHRPREPRRWSAASTASAARRPSAAARSCSSASTSSTPPSARPRPTRAACAGGSTSPPRSSPARRCSSSTSRRPASTRAAGWSLWATIEGLVAEGTTVLLTTQYLDEADRLADRIAVIDHGQRHRRGHARRAQGPRRRRAPRGPPRRRRPRSTRRSRALAPMSDEAPIVDEDTVKLTVRQRTGTIVEAVRRLDEAGVGVDDLGLRRPDARRRVPVAHRPRGRGGRRRAGGGGGMRRLVSDTLVIAERNLVRLPRAPDLLLAFTVQPVMFVLLFVYVFGGAISTPGLRLRRLPDPRDHRPEHRLRRVRHGARAQRGPPQGPDRPLPLAADGARRRCSAGRTLADVVTNLLSIVVLLVTGLIIGFSFDASVRRDRRRDRAAAALRLRVLVGLRAARAARLLARVGELGRLHRRLPADLHLVGLRAGRLDAGRRCSGSPRSTRSRSWSTRCARCGSARRPATTCGAPSSGRS